MLPLYDVDPPPNSFIVKLIDVIGVHPGNIDLALWYYNWWANERSSTFDDYLLCVYVASVVSTRYSSDLCFRDLKHIYRDLGKVYDTDTVVSQIRDIIVVSGGHLEPPTLYEYHMLMGKVLSTEEYRSLLFHLTKGVARHTLIIDRKLERLPRAQNILVSGEFRYERGPYGKLMIDGREFKKISSWGMYPLLHAELEQSLHTKIALNSTFEEIAVFGDISISARIIAMQNFERIIPFTLAAINLRYTNCIEISTCCVGLMGGDIPHLEGNNKPYLESALALQEMHQMNIIHGDIKADNFVWKDGKLMLIDFDLSVVGKHFGDFCAYIDIYRPPEIGEQISAASDIYALGKLFMSWEQGNQYATIEYMRDTRLKELVKWMTAINPEDRPNISQVINTLTVEFYTI